MPTENPEVFYTEVTALNDTFPVGISRELVEDDLGIETISKAAFENWAALNSARIERAATTKRLSKGGWPRGERPIPILSHGDLDDH